MAFESLWNRHADFRLPEKKKDNCVYAREFSEWTNDLCAKVKQSPNIVAVNQGELSLLKKYFEFRNSVPRNHRDRLGKVGHECIFQVFERAFESLREIELKLTPPPLFSQQEPSPPAPPAPPAQISGIFLGEVDNP